ncbi:hypothetical protein AAC387_Pa03g1892 [Persea americana]
MHRVLEKERWAQEEEKMCVGKGKAIPCRGVEECCDCSCPEEGDGSECLGACNNKEEKEEAGQDEDLLLAIRVDV